jgi:triosephosphate isomerase
MGSVRPPRACDLRPVRVITSHRPIAQGCGAFTGEMAVDQMVDLGLKCCLIGHSERRGEFGLPTPKESDELLATKAAYILDKGLLCVYCIGEPLPLREKGLEALMAEAIIPQLSSSCRSSRASRTSPGW